VELIARISDASHALTVEPIEPDDSAASSAASADTPIGARASTRFRVTIDGRPHLADLAPIDDRGGYSLLLDGRPFDVAFEPGGRGVRVGDRVFPIEVDDARRARASLAAARPKSAANETVISPMPGIVVSIPVAAGDLVRAGQTVAVIEAMKMQNELVAAAAGRVREVRVKPAQIVDSGDALVIIERESA